jgi:hypothetical protein
MNVLLQKVVKPKLPLLNRVKIRLNKKKQTKQQKEKTKSDEVNSSNHYTSFC